MFDHEALRQRIEADRPYLELKDDQLCIAIIPHTASYFDTLASNDCMWVKCPLSKKVEVLLNAYQKRYQPSLQYQNLLHKGSRLDPSDKVSVLDDPERRDNVIVIKATDTAMPLSAEYIASIMTPPPALAPVKAEQSPRPPSAAATRPSSSAISIPTSSVAPESARATQTWRAPLTPDQYQTPTPVPATPPNLHMETSTTENMSTTEMAWADFNYCRRSWRTHRYGPSSLDHILEQHGINQEWHKLDGTSKKQLEERARQLDTSNLFTRRAFWDFYSKQYNQSAALENVYMNHEGFGVMLRLWKALDESQHQKHGRQLRMQSDVEIPPLPTIEDHAPEASIEPKEADIQDFRQGLADDGQFAEALRAADESNAITTRLNLNEMFSDASTTVYEKGVAKGLDILSKLRATLNSAPGPKAEQWLAYLAKVEQHAERTRTVIGVVGATGAGKSSVINALMDEERLLPTNCMRACTAVVTEISFNYKNDRYRAEIEFISRDEWRKELELLYQELLDANGNVAREATMNEDSEAGIAYAKMKAVYPHLTREDMSAISMGRLMDHSNAKVLGTTQDFESTDALSFYQRLQQYVDSREKSRGGPEKDSVGPSREYWPLIKVVRLYVRAAALKTGAVIVDLPGVHDSNQARAAVAQKYMKQCTGLWIVAPITRAVDDKSAKTLMGETFKRQLKIDGAYSAVTFICSKTDDISITEAMESLELDEELQDAHDNITRLTRARADLQKQLKDQKDLLTDVNEAMEKTEDEIDVWEDLHNKAQNGKTVYQPMPKKRKKSASPKARKRPKYAEADSDDEFVVSDDEDGSVDKSVDETDDELDRPREPVTEEDAYSKLEELRSAKKEARRSRIDIEKIIKDIKSRINTSKEEQQKSDAVISTACIAGRNNYSRQAIKQDFASGIKELDMENAEEEDAANFNPDEELRDYHEVAASLPVFCVSSRGYQKLMGRLKKDKNVNGFEDVDATEIPQLQSHCSKLTEKNREAACKRFLNSLNALLNSLRLWRSSDGTSANLTDEQLQREKDVLEGKLDQLDTALEKQVRQVVHAVREELEHQLYAIFPAAIEAAKTQAASTQSNWAQKPGEGGLHWSTYKAVVRRDGVYTNYKGLHHFNEQLTEPIIRAIANAWERTFTRRIPAVLSTLVTVVKRLLETFHEEVEKRAVRNGASIAQFMMLKHNLAGYLEIVKDAADNSKKEISTKQKDVNREFVPVITNFMVPAYQYCTDERGTGSFKRMKAHMASHIDATKEKMFTESVDAVKNEITKMLRVAGDTLETSVDEVFMPLKRDYLQQVTGVSVAQAERLPREQRKMRKEVQDLVHGATVRFERVLGLASPSPEPEEAPANTAPDAVRETENEHAQPSDVNSPNAGAELLTHDHQTTSQHTASVAQQAMSAPDAARSQHSAERTHVKQEPAAEEDSLPDLSQILGSPRHAQATSAALPSALAALDGNASSSAAHTTSIKPEKVQSSTINPSQAFQKHDRMSSDSSKENVPFDFTTTNNDDENMYD